MEVSYKKSYGPIECQNKRTLGLSDNIIKSNIIENGHFLYRVYYIIHNIMYYML